MQSKLGHSWCKFQIQTLIHVMVTVDHGLAGARYAENYSELHHFHLDLRDVETFTGCSLSCVFRILIEKSSINLMLQIIILYSKCRIFLFLRITLAEFCVFSPSTAKIMVYCRFCIPVYLQDLMYLPGAVSTATVN